MWKLGSLGFQILFLLLKLVFLKTFPVSVKRSERGERIMTGCLMHYSQVSRKCILFINVYASFYLLYMFPYGGTEQIVSS